MGVVTGNCKFLAWHIKNSWKSEDNPRNIFKVYSAACLSVLFPFKRCSLPLFVTYTGLIISLLSRDRIFQRSCWVNRPKPCSSLLIGLCGMRSQSQHI